MQDTDARRRRFAPRRTLPIVLAALASVAAGCRGNGATAPRGPESVPVVVAQVQKKTVPFVVRGIGNAEATSTVSIRARVGGQLERVGFEEGKNIRKGDLLFVIDQRTYQAALAEAEGGLARDRALLKKAEEDVRRYAGLVEKDYVTKEQFDQVNANLDALRATIRADEAAVEAARLQLDFCTIRSPLSGRAGKLFVHPGNLVKANDDPALVVLLQTRPIWVTFSVPERYLPEIRKRSAEGPLEVTATARGEDGSPHRGRLEFVDNAVDASTGTIQLKGVFDNDDGGLWPGQFLEVLLTLSEQKDAVVVPSPAVQSGQTGTYVFVIDGGAAQPRPVTVSRTLGDDAVIEKGLDGGETVVTDGHLRLYPGAKVEVKPGAAK